VRAGDASLADRVRERVGSIERGERRARRVWIASLATAAAMLIVGLLVWPGAPWRGRGAASEPGEELLGALDVLEALDRGGVEPAPELAQALLEALDGSDPDLIELLLPEDVTPERL
jgi:hypothetical protein